MKHKQGAAPYLFLLPFLIVLAIFFLYAAGRALAFSFSDYNLFNTPSFVGLRNYRNLFAEQNFLRALKNSILFSVVVTTMQTIGALILASVLNAKIRGQRFFRAAFYLPSVASSVVTTLIFLWIFQRRGLLNYLITQGMRYSLILAVFLVSAILLQILQVQYERMKSRPAAWGDAALISISLMGSAVIMAVLLVSGFMVPFTVEPLDFVWLQTRNTFLDIIPIPLFAIMVQNTFTTIPTLMLLFLAGLQDVPKSLYEAAEIDGAGALDRFRHITIPSIQPVLFLVVTLGMIGTLQMFDQVAIFGDAVPLESVITLAYFVYNRMFPGAQLPEVGLASAAAVFLALLTLTMVLIQRRFIKSEVL